MAQAIDKNNRRSNLQQDTNLRFGNLREAPPLSHGGWSVATICLWKRGFQKDWRALGSDKEFKDRTLILEIPLTVSPATLKQQGYYNYDLPQ